MTMGERHYRMLRVAHIFGRAKKAVTIDNIKEMALKYAKASEGYQYLEREINKYSLHPVVQTAYSYCYRYDISTNWLGTVLVEWPHRSEKDPEMIAYTQNKDKGERDIQTPVRVGRYLKRIIPELTDKALEFLVTSGKKSEESTYTLLKDAALVQAVLSCTKTGPRSCMVGPGKPWSEEDHPYRAYASRFGWAMVGRYEGSTLMARAIVNGDAYVRVYGPTEEGEFSNPDDPMLREWLNSNSYTKISSWAGKKLARIEYGDNSILAPYLDGDCDHVTDDVSYLSITPRGELEFDDTSGYVEIKDDHDGFVQTVDGDWIPDDEATFVDYRYGLSRRRGVYHQDACVYVRRLNDTFLLADCTRTWSDDWDLSNRVIELTAGRYKGRYALDEDCKVLADGTTALTQESVERDEDWSLDVPF